MTVAPIDGNVWFVPMTGVGDSSSRRPAEVAGLSQPGDSAATVHSKRFFAANRTESKRPAEVRHPGGFAGPLFCDLASHWAAFWSYN
jgi:hypothetical protein